MAKGVKDVKAVILSLNSKYIHASLAPWYLKAAAEEKIINLEISVVESTINRTIDEPIELISKLSPKLLACSCYIWNINETLKIAEEYKKENPDTIVVLGGPEVSYRSASVLNDCPFVDAVISGEGELPFAKLCENLQSSRGLLGIEGVSCREGNELHIAEPYVTDEEPPNPYSTDFFKQLNGRIPYIEGSRGCPFRCAFCLSGRCGTVRYFGLSRVKNDILRLANSGAKTIKFVDRTFNANRKRAMGIWSFIIENCGDLWPRDVCFHFEIAGDLLDEKSLSLLKTAPHGVIQVEIGMQSFNEKTLESINRKTDVLRLCQNIKTLVSFGNIHTHVDLIAGLPHEDMQSFKNSFNTAYSLGADNLQLGFLKLLYGAPMREERELYPCDYTAAPPYEVTATPWLTSDDIGFLKNLEDALERLSNSGRFKYTLNYLINELSMNPFELFGRIGNELKTPQKTSLNEYVEKLYSHLSMYEQTDIGRLRDCLVFDKLTSDASGYIPKALQINDPALKICKREFNLRYGKGKKLGIAILYSGNPKAVCVDYSDTETDGSYAIYHFPLDEFAVGDMLEN